MKIDISKIQPNQPGTLMINIENVEDFWTLANVIRTGDRLTSQVRRKVVRVLTSGKTRSEVKVLKATIAVTEVQYQSGVDEMQVRGTLTHELEDAKEGSFQRMLLSIGRPFSLYKSCWDKFSYDEMREAGDECSGAEVAAVVMQSGLASICIIGRNSTVVTSTVSKAIPKMRVHGSNGKNAESKQKFFDMTAKALVSNVDVHNMRCIIIASPGFLQSEFLSFITSRRTEYGLQNELSRGVFVTGVVPSGHSQELEGLLAQPEMQKHVATLKAAVQANAMQELLKQMNTDMDCVILGENTVKRMDEVRDAIKKLLVTDNYIRGLELKERLEFLEEKERLEKMQVQVIVFSVKHQSGEHLAQLGGIAAILKYAMPEAGAEEFDDDVPFDDGL